MPLRSKLLAIPELRERYLKYVKQIAQDSLNWKKLGPVVSGYHTLVTPIVKSDTRKLSSYEAFVAATKPGQAAAAGMSYQKFAAERSKHLLKSDAKQD